MRIFIDIGHPAHVHYFRNFIKIMEKKGHVFFISARERGIIEELLNYYKINYIVRGEGSNSFAGKFLYMIYADYKVLKLAKKFKPDVFLSFSSPYAAQVSYLLKKPHIVLNDTEHIIKMFSLFIEPFSSISLTPSFFKESIKGDHISFKSVMENFYLEKDFFEPLTSIKQDLGLNGSDEYVLLRFVSWNAFHDYKEKGIDQETGLALIKILEKKYRVFISSEGELPEIFRKYKINIPIYKMHDVLAFASLYIGESATMASESALLGTPVVYINSLPLMGYLEFEQEYGLLKYFNSSNGVIEYTKNLIEQKDLNLLMQKKAKRMRSDFINATNFLVWFVENYPESKKIMKKNPDYQLKFK